MPFNLNGLINLETVPESDARNRSFMFSVSCQNASFSNVPHFNICRHRRRRQIIRLVIFIMFNTRDLKKGQFETRMALAGLGNLSIKNRLREVVLLKMQTG